METKQAEKEAVARSVLQQGVEQVMMLLGAKGVENLAFQKNVVPANSVKYATIHQTIKISSTGQWVVEIRCGTPIDISNTYITFTVHVGEGATDQPQATTSITTNGVIDGSTVKLTPLNAENENAEPQGSSRYLNLQELELSMPKSNTGTTTAKNKKNYLKYFSSFDVKGSYKDTENYTTPISAGAVVLDGLFDRSIGLKPAPITSEWIGFDWTGLINNVVVSLDPLQETYYRIPNNTEFTLNFQQAIMFKQLRLKSLDHVISPNIVDVSDHNHPVFSKSQLRYSYFTRRTYSDGVKYPMVDSSVLKIDVPIIDLIAGCGKLPSKYNNFPYYRFVITPEQSEVFMNRCIHRDTAFCLSDQTYSDRCYQKTTPKENVHILVDPDLELTIRTQISETFTMGRELNAVFDYFKGLSFISTEEFVTFPLDDETMPWGNKTIVPQNVARQQFCRTALICLVQRHPRVFYDDDGKRANAFNWGDCFCKRFQVILGSVDWKVSFGSSSIETVHNYRPSKFDHNDREVWLRQQFHQMSIFPRLTQEQLRYQYPCIVLDPTYIGFQQYAVQHQTNDAETQFTLSLSFKMDPMKDIQPEHNYYDSRMVTGMGYYESLCIVYYYDDIRVLERNGHSFPVTLDEALERSQMNPSNYSINLNAANFVDRMRNMNV